MQSSRSLRTLALALVLTAAPALLSAQQTTPATPPAGATATPPQGDPQAWIMELQDLHTRLEALQERALADPQLSAEQEALGESIKGAMVKADPELDAKLERMKVLEQEVAAAQQANDTQKLAQLSAEAQGIEQRFVAAQQQVLQQPEIAAQLSAFQEKLQKRMMAEDPSAEKLIARFQELQQRLAAVMQQNRN